VTPLALDQVEVMRHFGFERFALCGHDRGGRVGYRMALDHPGVVTTLAVLDIVPTWEAFSRADMAFGLSYWHWFFLAQPYDLPERLLAADPEKTLFRGGSELFHPEAMEEYVRCLRDHPHPSFSKRWFLVHRRAGKSDCSPQSPFPESGGREWTA
jgi:haloacetate dehalogenase